jgi:hypothetical protein
METANDILHDYPRHRDASACRVAEMVIEELSLENSFLRERNSSLEADNATLRGLCGTWENYAKVAQHQLHDCDVELRRLRRQAARLIEENRAIRPRAAA